MNDLTAEQRKALIDSKLKEKGLFVDAPQLTPAQKVCQEAAKIYQDVSNQVLRPLLKSLKMPHDYSRSGTQHLLCSAFVTRFSKLSKDEAIALLAVMHTEELEEQAYAMAQAGLVGEFMDKPI